MDSCFRRRCMSSAGRRSIPLITLSPKLLLNSFSSSITWTNPLCNPNSTWKYGKFLGIEPRRPFSLVSMSFFALCWLHSSSASSIAYSNMLEINNLAYPESKSRKSNYVHKLFELISSFMFFVQVSNSTVSLHTSIIINFLSKGYSSGQILDNG